MKELKKTCLFRIPNIYNMLCKDFWKEVVKQGKGSSLKYLWLINASTK